MNNAQNYKLKFIIEEGYAVRDIDDNEFGTVKSVHYTNDEPIVVTAPPTEPLIAPAGLDGHAVPLVTGYGTLFDDVPELPDEYRRHFYATGFVRIGRGLFHSDMLASFDQISNVVNETVYLNVSQDDLLKV